MALSRFDNFGGFGSTTARGHNMRTKMLYFTKKFTLHTLLHWDLVDLNPISVSSSCREELGPRPWKSLSLAHDSMREHRECFGS